MARFRALKPFLVIVALLCGLVPLLSSAANADPDCPDVLVLGSRGSGEDAAANQGLGKPVEAFWEDFRQLVPAGKTVKVWPNPYPAVPVIGGLAWVNGALAGLSRGNWGAYGRSVRDGVAKLGQEITDRVAACGTRTQLVLSGYSQGGQVTAEAYENLPSAARDRVLGVALFGEPKFNSESAAAEGNFEVGRNGTLGKRGEYLHPGPVLSYCHALDPVCQGIFDFHRRSAKRINYDYSQHFNYPTFGDYESGPSYPLQAARTFVNRLRPAPPGGAPTAVITPVDAAVVGEPFAISAAQSEDPQDRRLTYAWDLDDSGQFATPSPGPIVHATFDSPGDKRIRLRVTNDAGQSATTYTVISLFAPDDFTGPPGKPTSVTATPSADQTKATLSWNAPADGPPAETYEVLTSDGDYYTYVDHGGSASITLDAVDLPMSLMVRATNRAGTGAPSDPVVVSVAGPGKPSGDLNELWNTYGDQGGHWTGGDRTASVRLPDGRTAWLFSDTFLGTVNPDHSRPANTPMPRNTLVVQNADGSLGATLHGGTAQAPRSLIETDDAGTVLWVGDGIVEGGALKVLYNRYSPTGAGGLDVKLAGTSLATFSLPDLKLTDLRALPVSANVAWGSEIITDGGYTYIYGAETVTAGPRAAKVARSSSVGGTWEFWTGSEWSAQESAAQRIVTGVGTAFSVTKIGNEYALVTMDSNTAFSSTVVGYSAAAPTGPFTAPRTLYRAPEVNAGGKPIIVYDASIHTQYTSGSRITLSYNVNSLNPDDNLADAGIYRPRFVNVDWTPAPTNPDDLPPAPADLAARDNGDGTATLTWSPVSQVGVVYRVYQRDLSAGQWSFTPISAAYPTPTANLGFLQDQHQYEFRVTAEGFSGESPPSNTAELTVHVGKPEAPTQLTAVAGSLGQISLTWTKSPSPGLVTYRVVRRDVTAGEPDFLPINFPDPGKNTVTDKDLTHQHTYEYKVTANRSGQESDPSNVAQATAYYALPGAPSRLTATSRADGQIDLGWQAPEENAWYWVYVKDLTIGQADYTKLGYPITTCCAFTVGLLQHNHRYEFAVSAINRGGEGQKSSPATATSTYPAPQPPTGLTATAGDGQVTLRWTASPTKDVFYWIYQRDLTTNESSLSRLPFPLSTCCEFTAGLLANDHRYEFAISATNQAGESARTPSAEATPRAPLPAKPTGLTATPQTDGTIKLDWQETTANVLFNLYQRDVTAGQDFVKLPYPVGACCTFTAGLLTHNHVYEFKVAAVNGTGESPHSDVARATAHFSPPPAPGNLLGLAAGDGNITLIWDAAGPNLFYWAYKRDVTAGEEFQRATYPTDRTEVTFGSLVHGHLYEFKVTAENAAGEGPASNAVRVTSYGGLPAPPGGLSATAGDGQATLTWTASPTGGAQYYVWQRDATAGQSWQRLPIPVNCCSFSPGYLANGHTYEFRITAANASGESTPSNVASARPMPPLPAAPGGLTATAGDGQVTLRWNASPSPSVLYWVEYRSNGDWTRLQYPLSTCCAFTVQYLANGTTYQFRVFATNLSGDSAPSNVASARPMPPLPAAPGGLTATAGDGQVTLNWNASPSPRVLYWVEYRAAGGNWTRLPYPLSDCCAFTVGYLGNGTTYEFRVFATNLSGDSAPSNVASARPMPPLPAAPGSTWGSMDGNGIKLQWWASTSPNVLYYVYYRTGNGAYSRLYYPFSQTFAWIPVFGPAIYEFYVTAVNLSGESGQSPHTIVRFGPPDNTSDCASAWGSGIMNPAPPDLPSQYAIPRSTMCGHRHGDRIDFDRQWNTDGRKIVYATFVYEIVDCETDKIVWGQQLGYPRGAPDGGFYDTGSLPITWWHTYRIHVWGSGRVFIDVVNKADFSPDAYYHRPFDAWSGCF